MNSDLDTAKEAERPEKRSPLECQSCRSEMKKPVRLVCQHYFCRECVIQNKCPICGRVIEADLLSEDKVLSYVIESSQEVTELCANCDIIRQPMYFCETCQQPLCTDCKDVTHQAKIFSAHQISLLEESWKRGRLRGGLICLIHNEPFLLFCLDSKKLLCIECFNSSSSTEKLGNFVSTELAHKICCEKLEKAALKMRLFQDKVMEQIELRKRLALELEVNLGDVVVDLEKRCSTVVDKIIAMKNSLHNKLNEEKNKREEHIKAQLKVLESLQDPLRVNLLSASIFCSYAPKMDLLHYFSDLSKAIQLILTNKVEHLKLNSHLSVDFDEELAKCLRQMLGLPDPDASIILSSAVQQEQTPLVTPAIFSPLTDKSTQAICPPLLNGTRKSSNAFCFPNGFNDILNNGYVSGKQNVHLLNMDLNTTFHECIQKIDQPMKRFVGEIARISKTLLNIQRDITLRRCVVNKEEFLTTVSGCEALKQCLEDHCILTQNLQPVFRDIWQEQMERIHRQQSILREKLDDIAYLQKFAEKALSSALQLKPFAFYMASVISVVDNRRSQMVNYSPMEQICAQITSLEPDSQHRIEAIQKEEESRRLTKEQEKLATKQEAQQVKEQLKETKTPVIKLRANHPTVVENNRDRSHLPIGGSALSKRKRRENRSSESSSICCSPTPLNTVSPSLSLDCSSAASTPPLSFSPLPPPPPPPPPSSTHVPTPSPVQQPQAKGKDEQTPLKFFPHNSANTPSSETMKARESLLESIKERVKKIEPFDEK
uniref:RING finger protein 207 n=1 Tax=Ditylenchus dipsaci TaxID=166011 RepID=A0A915D4V0_9BILA